MDISVSGWWVSGWRVAEHWLLIPRVLVPERRSCVSWWETPDIMLLQRGVLGNVDRSIWREENHR